MKVLPLVMTKEAHKLERKWTFWFDNETKLKQGAAWGTSLRKVQTPWYLKSVNPHQAGFDSLRCSLPICRRSPHGCRCADLLASIALLGYFLMVTDLPMFSSLAKLLKRERSVDLVREIGDRKRKIEKRWRERIKKEKKRKLLNWKKKWKKPKYDNRI